MGLLERNGGLGACACLHEQFCRAHERVPPVRSVLAHNDADNDVLQHKIARPLRRHAFRIFAVGHHRIVPARSRKGLLKADERRGNRESSKERLQHHKHHLMRVFASCIYAVLSGQPFFHVDKRLFLEIHK